ncbi:MAG: Crp/Fnr family transcriptional regulator [Pseudolabrys sp.]|nr:Crp/Fnr family transcriptional regulator [Pseudolabrys sp.]MDP2297282.1 Crp/Fnr family transcriptional regulator [Pseudolabrys sp.]
MARKQKLGAIDPASFLAKAGPGRTNLKLSAGAVVYAQGDPCDAIYYIQDGKAKITVTAESGKEAVLSIIGTGDFFGEGCMNGHPLRMGSVVAMTECSLMRIDKAAMLAELHEKPEFSEVFIAHLLHRNSRIEEDLVDQLFNSSEKRLARTLLLLANFGKEGKPEPVLAKISQETLAEMVGTTRSRVSFFMNKFRRLGLVEYNGHIKVNSSLLSVVLNDGVKSDRKSLSGGR